MLLIVNVDSITGEALPYLIDGLMAHGASSVHAIPAITKKGRSEYIFLIDLPKSQLEGIRSFLSIELDTLGMRAIEPEHIPFHPIRNGVVRMEFPNGEGDVINVNVKILAGTNEEIIQCKAEYEDLKAALNKINRNNKHVFSFKVLKAAVELAVMSQTKVNVYGYVFNFEEPNFPTSH